MAHFNPTEDELTAALAAINYYLSDTPGEAEETPNVVPWQWRASALLTTQGIAPLRTYRRPTWNDIERLRRAERGVIGILGL